PQPKNLDATRLAHPTAAPGAPPGALRFGLTVSKKVGKAVTRNRARRRLRALALSVLAQEAAPGHDYVLIGRGATPDRAFSALQSDLRAALTRLKLLRKPEDAQR
ncbi:MAG: ribonuclease P protein component, partial [Rhodospirillaceae bacterium]